MHISGIIAEFNPFHNGHAFFISQIRKLTNADYIAAVISGDFMQRGAPAIANKYLRTRMALAAGVDFVFELPTVWACASAEDFAKGGIRLLQQLGIVDSLCFGTEQTDLTLLSAAASVLSEEPEEYRILLQQFLAKGCNFPTARTLALQSCPQLASYTNLADTLEQPNTILGIEYLKALQYFNASIQPVAIERKGSYHISNTESKTNNSDTFAGASFIRQKIEELLPLQPDIALSAHVPIYTYDILKEYWQKQLPVNWDMAYPYLSLSLLKHLDSLTDYADFPKELANRLQKVFSGCSSMEELMQALKTKQYTYTRICRALLHVLLDIKTDTVLQWKSTEYAPYARLLGFRRSSASLFSALQENSQIPIITNMTNILSNLDTQAADMLSLDIQAADLYELICRNQWKSNTSKNEFSQGLIVC